MTNLLKTLITGATFVGFAATASAQQTFEAEFSYNPDASIEETYADFERTAKSVCEVDLRDVGSIGTKLKMERDCREQLMSEAVVATQSAALISLHAERTDGLSTPPIYAATDEAGRW